ncbi:MAG: PDZ domain-containing protein [Chloroflexi bacterium]|nr:MAG: PDZ domain-containing protein [Chloroflexota bacterium]
MKHFTKWKDTAVTILIAVVWFAIGWVANGRFQNSDTALFKQVQEGLIDHHVDELPSSREMTYDAIRGMIAGVDDPYAAFFEPAMGALFQQDYQGNTGVTGILLDLIGDQWEVIVLLPGEPAAEAGLLLGDVVLSIGGVSLTSSITDPEIALLLRGPADEPVEFVVQRGEETLTFAPIRKARPIVSSGEMLDGDIAYFAQYTFTANSPELVKAELTQLLAQNPRAIIWDLRSNGGGSMDAAQENLSYFIDEGLLFTVALKDGKERPYPANGNTLAPNIPLVVLIGERTYSSAETAAISIAENERGILIGSTTFGKGTVQETVPLLDDSMLQYTVAHWLSPSGVWVEKKGVAPQIYVEDDPATEADEVIEEAVRYIEMELK